MCTSTRIDFLFSSPDLLAEDKCQATDSEDGQSWLNGAGNKGPVTTFLGTEGTEHSKGFCRHFCFSWFPDVPGTL